MIEVKVIKPTAPSALAGTLLNQAIVDSAIEVGDFIKKDYEETIETWNTKPVFKQATRSSAIETIRSTWTSSDIYRYVHDGTDVKYVVLTPDFVPKTLPLYIGSFPGRGGVLRFDFKRPSPGIIARNFTDTIITRNTSKMVPITGKNIRKAVNASGYSHS